MTDRSLARAEEEGSASFSPQDQEQPQQRSLADGMECLQLPLLHHRSPPPQHQESSARCLQQQQRQDEEDALPLPPEDDDDQDVVVASAAAAQDRNALDRWDSLLSSPEGAGVNHSGRRRARTLEVEWGGTFSYDDDDDNSSLASGSEDPLLFLGEEDASVDQEQQPAVEPTFAPPPQQQQQQHHYHNYGDSAHPPTSSNDHYHLERYHRCRHALHKSRVLRVLLLFCMYGSMEIWPNHLLWAEPVLIVDDAFPAADDRWTMTTSNHGLSALAADRVQQQQPRQRQWRDNQNNNTVATSAAVRRAQVASAASVAEGSGPFLDTKFKTTVPLYRLPHFSNPRGPALRKTPPTLLRTNQHQRHPNSEARARNGTHAPGHYPMTAFAYYALEGDEADAHNSTSTNNKKKRPRYHSTMPPGADPRHWKKIPPPLPSKNSKNNNNNDGSSSSGPYRKKKPRPILSYAHSYRLRQEALVFGHESNINFLSDSGDAPQTYRPPNYYYSANDDSLYRVLIWMTLILLVLDTLYREYQHVQWRRRSRSTLHGESVGSTRPSGSPRLFLLGMRRYYQYAAHHGVVASVMGRPSNNSTSAGVFNNNNNSSEPSTPANATSPLVVRQRHRSSHYRRSPSPPAAAAADGCTRVRLPPRRLVDPTDTAGTVMVTPERPLLNNNKSASPSWRPRRRFDSY